MFPACRKAGQVRGKDLAVILSVEIRTSSFLWPLHRSAIRGDLGITATHTQLYLFLFFLYVFFQRLNSLVDIIKA